MRHDSKFDWATSIRFKQPKIGTPEYLEYVGVVYQPSRGMRGVIKSSSSSFQKRKYVRNPKTAKPLAEKKHSDCLCGGLLSTHRPDYLCKDTKMSANKFVCETLKRMNLQHNGMVSVIEEVTLNSLAHLLEYNFLNSDSVVNLINCDKRKCAEMTCKISKMDVMKDKNVMIASMNSSVFLKGNTTPHRLLWLDLTHGASKTILYGDIQRAFQSNIFCLGGVFAVTFTLRGAPMKHNEIHKMIHIFSEAYGFKINCVKNEGTSYFTECSDDKDRGEDSWGYRGIVMYVYEVRPSAMDSDGIFETMRSDAIAGDDAHS